MTWAAAAFALIGWLVALSVWAYSREIYHRAKAEVYQEFADKTGIIVNRRDPQAFAREVLALFASPTRRARMAVTARAHARSYDLAAAVAATWELYRGVATQRARVAS